MSELTGMMDGSMARDMRIKSMKVVLVSLLVAGATQHVSAFAPVQGVATRLGRSTEFFRSSSDAARRPVGLRVRRSGKERSSAGAF